MKVSVTVKNRAEGAALQAAMDEPTIRALVMVAGTVAQLPTVSARRRVLEFVLEKLHDDDKPAPEPA